MQIDFKPGQKICKRKQKTNILVISRFKNWLKMNNELYYNTFWVNIYAEAFEIISFVYSGNILFINRGAVDNKSIDKLL